MIEIDLNESNASKRVIPIWCVQSNGSSAATNESGGQPQLMLGGAFLGNTVNTLSSVSVLAGEYYSLLSTSEVSTEGIGAVYYSSATALAMSAYFRVRIPNSNISTIRGSAPAAIRLLSHISSVVTGQVVAGSLSAAAFTTDVPSTVNSFYNGRLIIFTSGNLAGQATSINTSGGYIGFSNTSSLFNVATLTAAPSNGDNLIVV